MLNSAHAKALTTTAEDLVLHVNAYKITISLSEFVKTVRVQGMACRRCCRLRFLMKSFVLGLLSVRDFPGHMWLWLPCCGAYFLVLRQPCFSPPGSAILQSVPQKTPPNVPGVLAPEKHADAELGMLGGNPTSKIEVSVLSCPKRWLLVCFFDGVRFLDPATSLRRPSTMGFPKKKRSPDLI